MKDTPFALVLQSQKNEPHAYLKGVKSYEIQLTEDERIRLIDMHESRTVILDALMKIDAQQDEIRHEIMKRTGIDGIVYFRNGNLF